MTAYMFNLPFHGHINPCLSLVQELAGRGERIVFYGIERFRRAAEAAGATFRVFEHAQTEPANAMCSMAEWQMRVVEKVLGELVEDAAREKPSCLLVDYMCLWGRFLSQYLRVPTAVIHTTYPVLTRPSRLLYLSISEAVRLPGALRKTLAFRAATRRVAKTWRVPRLAWPYGTLNADYGDLHLVLTSRDMMPAQMWPDDRFMFVGPCVRPAGLAGGDPLPPLDGRPILYISLGTVWNHSGAIYRAAIEALHDAPIQVLIAGSRRMPADLRDHLPANFFALEHVDQIETLSRAAAFITHGGMNSVCEALTAEVPMLVYPQGFDQFSQARYVEGAGCGFELKPEGINAGNLRAMVERLLRDPEVRASCRRVGDHLRSSGGARKAADLVTALCDRSQGGPDAQRVTQRKLATPVSPTQTRTRSIRPLESPAHEHKGIPGP